MLKKRQKKISYVKILCGTVFLYESYYPYLRIPVKYLMLTPTHISQPSLRLEIVINY